MTKELAFLIWLYDKENEYSGDIYSESLIAEIREKYADLFDINAELSRLYTE